MVNNGVTLVDNYGAYAPLPPGSSYYHTAANTAGHQVKASPGVFYGLSVNTAGLTSSVTIYDGTSTGGAVVGVYSTLAQGGPVVPANGIAFLTGLYIVAAGGTAADITVLYI